MAANLKAVDGLKARREEIETALQQADHVLAGVARTARGVGVIAAELLLGDVAVIALELLLGLKLRAIVGKLLGAALAVLAGTVRALVDRALAPTPKVLAHAAVEFVFGSDAFRHADSKLIRWKGQPGLPGKARTIASAVRLSTAFCIA